MCLGPLDPIDIAEPLAGQTTANNVPILVVTNNEDSNKAGDDSIEISPELEKELCLAINRELHVSYCYLVMSGIFTRQGLKSFSGMCTRQEDYHR